MSTDNNLDIFDAMHAMSLSPESVDAIRQAKVCFQRSIRHRIERLAKRAAILRLKYSSKKRVFDGVQIAIIVVSSLLTLLESLKVQLDVEEEERDVQRTFALLPIFLSSSVTVSLAVLKFLRLQEHMEDWGKVLLKATTTQFVLKKVEEDLTVAITADQVRAVFESYTSDVFSVFNSTEEQIESCLMLRDFVRHSPGYHEMSLLVRQDEELFTAQCQALADGHTIEDTSSGPLSWFGWCCGWRKKKVPKRQPQQPPAATFANEEFPFDLGPGVRLPPSPIAEESELEENELDNQI